MATKRDDCNTCDLWRISRANCGILAIQDLPPTAHLVRRTATWFDAITAPPDPNATRPPGWDADRARAAIATIGQDDAAARAYLTGAEATCAAHQPLRRIPRGEQ